MCTGIEFLVSNLNDKGRRRYACNMKHTGSLAGFCLTFKTKAFQLAETKKKPPQRKKETPSSFLNLLRSHHTYENIPMAAAADKIRKVIRIVGNKYKPNC
jgi:hypothetical protein